MPTAWFAWVSKTETNADLERNFCFQSRIACHRYSFGTEICMFEIHVIFFVLKMDDLWRFKQLFSGIRIFDMFRPEIKVSTAYDRLVFVVDMCLRIPHKA